MAVAVSQREEPLGSARPSAGLQELAGRARPVALARERLLPVLAPLAPLLPDGGLRRGSTVAVSAVGAGVGAGVGGGLGGGATSLALALVAGPSAAGSWCACVGGPSDAPGDGGLGLVAAAGFGVVLERFPLVAPPRPGEWATVVAALLDAFDVVCAWPPGSGRLRSPDVRRLQARARERGSVLVVPGRGAAGRVEGADVRLAVVASAWSGVGVGHGRLTARRVDVMGSGRGAAARERRVSLWLPGPDGGVAAASAPWAEEEVLLSETGS